MSVPNGVRELIDAAPQQFASDYPTGQPKLERFREAGLAGAVRAPDDRCARRQVECLWARSISPKSPHTERVNFHRHSGPP